MTVTSSSIWLATRHVSLDDESQAGGIYAYGNVTVTSSTISGNSAGAGGGIATRYGDVTVTSSTISGNNPVHGRGGGILARAM